MKHITTLILLFGLLLAGQLFAQDESTISPPDTTAPTVSPPASVTEFRVVDKINDRGQGFTLSWVASADDGAGAKSVLSYKVEMAPSADGPWDSAGVAVARSSGIDVVGNREPGEEYIPDHTDTYFRVLTLTADPAVYATSEPFGPVQCKGQWFHRGKAPVLVAVLIFGFLTIYFVGRARKGADLYVRPLAGIEAVDDAIGRATEMGKPILYVLGLGTAADIATIASFTILGRVAKRVAEYHTSIIVPTYDPIVMTVAQEVVKSSYMDAGFPDEYDEDSVFFVTQSQFAYVAAVNGIMLRELPATNIYMGKFFAESLILSETGAVAGSIQISGTDEIAQIPFFIVACDYTLIAEELYAASAYLSREPILLGSLKAQDYAKAAVIILALIGLISANLGWSFIPEWFHVID